MLFSSSVTFKVKTKDLIEQLIDYFYLNYLTELVCLYDDLPKVINGYFNHSLCSGNRIGDWCKATCNNNYFTIEVLGTECIPSDVSVRKGVWSRGSSFACEGMYVDGIY